MTVHVTQIQSESSLDRGVVRTAVLAPYPSTLSFSCFTASSLRYATVSHVQNQDTSLLLGKSLLIVPLSSRVHDDGGDPAENPFRWPADSDVNAPHPSANLIAERPRCAVTHDMYKP